MKKRYILILLCIIAFVSLLVVPCSAAGIVDPNNINLSSSYYYNSNSSSDGLKILGSNNVNVGESDGQATSLSVATKVPNYFVETLSLTSNDGLPICDKGSYEFTLSSFARHIDIEDGVYDGLYYLKSIRQRSIKVYYFDGTSTTYSPNGFSSFEIFFGSNDFFSFTFSFNAEKPIEKINIRLFYSMNDFGLPFLTGNEDLFDWGIVFTDHEFAISRDESYLKANNGLVNDAHDREQSVLNDSFSDLEKFTTEFNTTKNLLNPNSGAGLDQGGIYKGALFIGNLMKSVVEKMPFLNNLLTISLSVGVFTIVLGLVSEAFSPRHVKSSNPKKESKKKVKDKNKGSA